MNPEERMRAALKEAERIAEEMAALVIRLRNVVSDKPAGAGCCLTQGAK